MQTTEYKMLNELFQPAAGRLAHRCNIAEQILADLATLDKLIPVESFNDDDWYVYEVDSLKLICTFSSKSARPVPFPGENAARGMRAKHLGLWRV
jgi:hypothetical protein